MLAALLEGGITCEYCHLNALSYQITEVDKVRFKGHEGQRSVHCCAGWRLWRGVCTHCLGRLGPF